MDNFLFFAILSGAICHVTWNILLKKSKEYESKIDESLIVSYKKIRSSVRNGLAVVAVERGASAGSFFTIPPQVQLDIASRKKLIAKARAAIP